MDIDPLGTDDGREHGYIGRYLLLDKLGWYGE